jgi:hypothetical protein
MDTVGRKKKNEISYLNYTKRRQVWVEGSGVRGEGSGLSLTVTAGLCVCQDHEARTHMSTGVAAALSSLAVGKLCEHLVAAAWVHVLLPLSLQNTHKQIALGQRGAKTRPVAWKQM